MAPLLDVDAWPNLREPVMVVCLTGWVDAGVAGAGAMAVLNEQLASQREFGTIDLADLMDLQQTRPMVSLADGITRTIQWPSIDFVAGSLGRDVVLCNGPEPSLRWREVLGEIVQAATRLGVTQAFTMAGIPSMVSHRRAVPIMSTVTSADLIDDTTFRGNNYVGPTGAQTALQVMLGDAGVPTVGLWAQVPHYVSSGASPPAIRALLARLREQAGLSLDLAALDDQADAYVRRVEEGIAERPDVADAIDAIDASESESAVAEDNLPSGDELATEIEKFLRGQA